MSDCALYHLHHALAKSGGKHPAGRPLTARGSGWHEIRPAPAPGRIFQLIFQRRIRHLRIPGEISSFQYVMLNAAMKSPDLFI
jgi:hypothetical protein